jgi:hypothetical protein
VRDQLLAAIRGCMGAVVRTRDHGEIMAAEALAEADQLLGFLASAESIDIEVAQVVGLFHGLRAMVRGDETARMDGGQP